MTDYLLESDAKRLDIALAGIVGAYGGMSLGTLHDQKFFALRASGADLRFPFPSRPFTALVNINSSLPESEMRRYAEDIMRHGCVQAVCLGEDSDRMISIFEELSEMGEYDKNGRAATFINIVDETLVDAIQYFVLPCDLANTGLLLVIGDSGDFQSAIDGFSTAAGLMKERIGEPVYAEDDLVCFVATP